MRRRFIYGILALSLALSGCSSAAGTSGGSSAQTDAADSEAASGENSTASGSIDSESAEALLQLLTTSKTTQYFTDESVPSEDIETILQAGINAESAMNSQSWHFSAVTAKELLEEIEADMSSVRPGGAPQQGKGAPHGAPAEGAAPPEGAEPPKEGAQPPDHARKDGRERPERTESPAGDTPAGDTESLQGGEQSDANTDSDADTTADSSQESTISAETGDPENSEVSEGTAASEQDASSTDAASQSLQKAGIADAPLAIVISCEDGSEFDAGLATQNMAAAALTMGYGVKIISSPTMVLNGEKQAEYSEALGIPEGMKAVAVLLVGKAADTSEMDASAITGASERNDFADMTTIITE